LVEFAIGREYLPDKDRFQRLAIVAGLKRQRVFAHNLVLIRAYRGQAVNGRKRQAVNNALALPLRFPADGVDVRVDAEAGQINRVAFLFAEAPLAERDRDINAPTR